MKRRSKKSSASREKRKAKSPAVKRAKTKPQPAKKSVRTNERKAPKRSQRNPSTPKTSKKASRSNPPPKRKQKPGRKKQSYQKRIVKTAVKETARTTKRTQRKISAQLRAFRRAIRKLQRAGVVSKNVNAKTAKPTKKLKATVKAFKPVVDGKAVAQKLGSKKWQRHYKQQGHVVRQGFVLLDNVPGHKYSTDERGIKTTRLEGRYETIELPIGNKKDLEKVLHEIEFNKKLDKLKRPDESWAFRFFGNNSRRIFKTLRQLVDYISQYDAIQNAIEGKGRTSKADLIQALEIVRVNASVGIDRWAQMPNKARDFKEENKAFKRRVNRAGRNEGFRQKDRHKPDRWQRLKETRPLQYQDALRKARARMKRIRKK